MTENVHPNRSGGAAGEPAPVPLGAWLAELPDDRLIHLLELRPDLAQPAPGSIAALAARAVARQSVKAATDELDFLRLAVIDALLVLQADATGVPVTKLVALIGDRAPRDAVLGALEDLRERALVWGDTAVRVPAEASSALPWYPGQVILEDADRPASEIAAAVEELDEPQRELLERLLVGSPMGRTRDAAPGTPPDRPVPRLLAAGLLRQIDADTVILPRRVGQVLRGEDPGPTHLVPPDPVVSGTTAKDVDAAAAGAVIDLMRETEVVLETLSAAPVPELRSGGLGVREAKRLSKLTGVDEQRLGFVLEVAAAAGLIASGIPDPEPPDSPGPCWTPTVAADRFLESSTAARWYLLASTWLDLPSRPSLIGSRGPDGKPYAALSDSLYSTAAPLDRRLLLNLLSDLPAGAGTDAEHASRALIWRRPRWAARLQPEPVAHLLDEAHALGLVGRGALSAAALALLRDGEEAAVDTMAKILPAPIDYFLVQADLTVVVPGPLERDLAGQLAVVADVESAGAAMVYRVSEASIRHALDTGRTAGALHAFFAKHSKTPVPQGLSYLIDDVARRHGQLRVGMASSFVRCEDVTLLAHAVAAPDPERQGPMLQAPQKRQELEMNPAERQLFERAMHLVQNKTGMTEEDAKKVATDVVLTARHTPGLSEKPEYMDVRNGHVMIAEKVGKEPIFNGYVNVEQSQRQTQEQLHDKVATQNQHREQQAEAERRLREPEQRNAAQVFEDNAAWRLSGHRSL